MDAEAIASGGEEKGLLESRSERIGRGEEDRRSFEPYGGLAEGADEGFPDGRSQGTLWTKLQASAERRQDFGARELLGKKAFGQEDHRFVGDRPEGRGFGEEDRTFVGAIDALARIKMQGTESRLQLQAIADRNPRWMRQRHVDTLGFVFKDQAVAALKAREPTQRAQTRRLPTHPPAFRKGRLQMLPPRKEPQKKGVFRRRCGDLRIRGSLSKAKAPCLRASKRGMRHRRIVVGAKRRGRAEDPPHQGDAAQKSRSKGISGSFSLRDVLPFSRFFFFLKR